MAKKIKQNWSGDGSKFAIRPFTAIKGIAVEKQQVDPKAVIAPVTRTESRSQAEEDFLFLTEMAGVTRIQRQGMALKSTPGQPFSGKRQSSPDPEESSLFLDALKAMKLDVKFSDDDAKDDAPVAPRKISRMKQLRRGTIRLNLEIDLHGLTRDEAMDALASFITAAARRGQQAVLVIAGKGVHSAGEPVLQGAVADWLGKEGKEWVTEFVFAPQNLGSDGAFVVFLKSVKREI